MKESEFRATLEKALESALSFLGDLDRMPVSSRVDLATLRRRLAKPLDDSGLPAEALVEDLVKDVEGAILGSASGRFFGWVIGGTLPAALAADWLTATWDQNAALYSCGPAAAVVEEVAGGWLKELLGLPADASCAFVTGTQMAHFTCLAAARAMLSWAVGIGMWRSEAFSERRRCASYATTNAMVRLSVPCGISGWAGRRL